MNKRLKGILAFAFLGGIMLTSGIVIGIPGILPQQQSTITNTPQDRFADVDRPRYCGTGEAESTPYLKEYKIERLCTQPLAITTDDAGDVWFTQSNTGNLGKFEPDTEEFSEFFNPSWPQRHAMMWGIIQHEDGSIWYTEDAFDSIWKYEPDTGAYLRVEYGLGDSTLPHRLVPLETLLVINDYTGGRISFVAKGEQEGNVGYWNLFSPLLTGITSEVAFDSQFDMWYANWREGDGGYLINFDTAGYYGAFDVEEGAEIPDVDDRDYVTTVELPGDDLVVNGIAIDVFDNIWFTDTNTNDFYRYASGTQEFTRYSTPPPSRAAYGNATGIIESPQSRPYFAETDQLGRIVFNESSANRIGVFDPANDSLTEYVIPSKNPYWSDCDEEDTECGIAQVLAFHLDAEKIWFTEWVENNIGVIDTAVEVPYTVSLEPQAIYTDAGATETVTLTIDAGELGPNAGFAMSDISGIPGLELAMGEIEILADSEASVEIDVITTEIEDGTYTVALGVIDDEVGRFSYLTVNVGIEEPTLADQFAGAFSGLVTESGEPISIESIQVTPAEGEAEPGSSDAP